MAKKQEQQQAFPGSPLSVVAQYLKDVTFENPNAFHIFSQPPAQPSLDVNMSTQVTHIKDRTFEVTLHVQATAKDKTEAMFAIELDYAGIFQLAAEIPEELVQPIVNIECPRLLFPFARTIVANTVSDGGFPPLMLAPVDFAALFFAQQQQAQEETKK